MRPTPYLLYPVVLWFPPLHELGHITIAQLIGEQILEIHFDYVIFIPNLLDYWQDIWQIMFWIPLLFILIWSFLYYKELKTQPVVG